MEKIWLKQYPSGVPVEINPDAFSSLVELFLYATSKFGDKTALYNMGARLTYYQLERKTRYFASYLQNTLHLKKGDRIAIMLPNTIQYIVAMLGALRAGLVVVNINPMYTPRELEKQINDAETDTIIVLSNFIHTIEEVLHTTPLKNIIITDISDIFSGIKSHVINFYLKFIKKNNQSHNISNPIYFKNVLKVGRKKQFIDVPISGNDVAFLQYTGGTTGVSKGAMLTHRNMVSNVEQAYVWMSSIGLEEGNEIIITALPLYHIFSLMANCFAFMKIGIMNVLVTNAKDIPSVIKEMSKFKFTIFTGVNTLFKALMRHRNFSTIDFSRLKIALSGGMALHRTVAEKWFELTGVGIVEAYGLTEASPAVCCRPFAVSEIFTGNIGVPFPSTDIKIVDQEVEELPLNMPGELCVKGPQVMLGYWKRPEETANVFTADGWLKTGDIAKVDSDGFVSIVDRKKDIIVVSGYNVYPNEVEEVIAEHPQVLEVAVIGVENKNTGEVIKAFIVRKDPSLFREDIVAFCRERLTSYKIPKVFEFCDELPKTNVGKILRRALRDERFREKNIFSQGGES